MTDPQTAADAAERVQAYLDAWETTEYLAEMTEVAGPFDGVPALTTYDLRTLLADRKRMAAELEQVRGERAAVEAWLGTRIEALRKVLRDERDATRAARTEAESLRQELDEAASIVMEIGEALNTTELYIAIGDLAKLFAPRTAALAEREAAETTATRPAGGKRTPEQWCAEYGIDIADPDGWRNTGDPAWDEPITLPDFLRRAAVSTTRGLTPDVWNRLSREAHEAADAEATASAARGATERGVAPEGSVS